MHRQVKFSISDYKLFPYTTIEFIYWVKHLPYIYLTHTGYCWENSHIFLSKLLKLLYHTYCKPSTYHVCRYHVLTVALYVKLHTIMPLGIILERYYNKAVMCILQYQHIVNDCYENQHDLHMLRF